MNAPVKLQQAESAEEALCLAMLRTEDEEEAVKLLDSYGYSLDQQGMWHPLGENAGNFSQVGNQQEEGTAALVEKVVNSIDAVLLAECHTAKIAPDSDAAPRTMQEAVDRFLGIKDGRLGTLILQWVAYLTPLVVTKLRHPDLPSRPSSQNFLWLA